MSIARKSEDLFEEINEPKLSIVISGTPGQLKPFFKSRENGLFSRFLYYTFDEISHFKNVFDDSNFVMHNEFEEFGQDLYSLYASLITLNRPIQFSLSQSQKDRFYESMVFLWDDIVENHTEAFLTNLKRHGLIFFRVAMILSAVRNAENLPDMEHLNCNESDFDIAMELTKTMLRHSQKIFDSLDNGILSAQDEELLDGLKMVFLRS